MTLPTNLNLKLNKQLWPQALRQPELKKNKHKINIKTRILQKSINALKKKRSSNIIRWWTQHYSNHDRLDFGKI